jgi:hypothetical protein
MPAMTKAAAATRRKQRPILPPRVSIWERMAAHKATQLRAIEKIAIVMTQP